MNRKALGRGLRSILPDAPAPPASPAARAPAREAAPGPLEGPRPLDIDRIRPNRAQPRQRFDEEALEGLARSLKEDGVLQPVIVRPLEDGFFELLAGERRWRAAQRAGLLRIPAIVRPTEDGAALEIALTENLQREDLNPIEEAAGYRSLATAGMTQQRIAERFGKQRATIANTLRLLTLPPSVQERVRRGELSAGQARAIVPLTPASEQERLAARAVREALSVRQIERIVEQASPQAPETGGPRATRKRDPNVVAAEQALQRALGTRIRIFEGPKGGRIELHFFSPEEMQRVYQILMDAARKQA